MDQSTKEDEDEQVSKAKRKIDFSNSDVSDIGDFNQLLNAGGDMQSKTANPILLMSAPDSVCLDATKSGANTAANVSAAVIEDKGSPKKLDSDEKKQ